MVFPFIVKRNKTKNPTCFSNLFLSSLCEIAQPRVMQIEMSLVVEASPCVLMGGARVQGCDVLAGSCTYHVSSSKDWPTPNYTPCLLQSSHASASLPLCLYQSFGLCTDCVFCVRLPWPLLRQPVELLASLQAHSDSSLHVQKLSLCLINFS